MSTNDRETPRGPLEFRNAFIDHIRDRIITLIAVPYDSAGLVEYRGQMWREIFERSAFEGLADTGRHRIRANRGHNKDRTVGRVVGFPRGVSDEGLVADIRIANTMLGDETLALADDDCLSASVAYAVLGDGQKLERPSMIRRISKAWLDHIAFVESPAYTGARVLSVREDSVTPEVLPPYPSTPELDSTVEGLKDILDWSAARRRNA